MQSKKFFPTFPRPIKKWTKKMSNFEFLNIELEQKNEKVTTHVGNFFLIKFQKYRKSPTLCSATEIIYPNFIYVIKS